MNEILKIKGLSIGYDKETIIKSLDFSVKQGKILTILGTNGSGKSTLLKTISRVLPYTKGEIFFKDKNIKKISNKEYSKQLAFVAQNNEIPKDIEVFEFIRYGRIPHKNWYEFYNKKDNEIVEWAIKECKLEKFKDRKVMMLSGGERQKVWIAMALAQKTELLILDEPTTYLDIHHQFEIMELIAKLNREFNITIIMVLHDLNQAIQYSDEVLILKDTLKYTFGTAKETLNPEVLENVYKVNSSLETFDEKPYFILKGIKKDL